MDHLIEYIFNYMWGDKEEFRKEWASGKYRHIWQCPTYPLIRAYCKAIADLDLSGEYDEITPEKLLEEE